MFNKFYPIVDTCLSCEDTARQVVRWCQNADFLHPVFSASRVQHISDVHSKFALRPHHLWKYGRQYIQSLTAEISRGKKNRKKDRNHREKYYNITYGDHK